MARARWNGWRARRIGPGSNTAFRLTPAHPGGATARMDAAPMDNVVKLEKPTTGKNTPRAQQTRPRRRRSRTALVLGGGGFTGGVYEIGALRALDLLSVNRTVNQFDVYVGTSAGAFVAAAVANGVTPEEMMRVIVQQVPTPYPDARVSALLRPNYLEFVAKSLQIPWRVLQLLRTLARDLGQIS